MGIFEIMKARHSVRSYNEKAINESVVQILQRLINECNNESGLNIQLFIDEPNAFDSKMASYGKIKNVKNYLALVGRKEKNLQEKIGYYGEKIVLKATELGLGSCWVAMTYSKGKCAAKVEEDEKLVVVISLGYFDKDGVAHKGKSIEKLSRVSGDMPKWFIKGMEAVQLAPTAMNQQKFIFSLDGNKVTATPGMGFYTKVDLGIGKYHFELGAGKENFDWA